MCSAPARALQSLRDLPGVLGSFVCAADGALLCRDLPAYFDDDALGEVGPRASRMLETWSASIEEAECVLRFEEHRLYLRGVDGGLLCVIVGPEVHVPAMRTAAGMVARRLRGSLSPPPPPPPPPAATAAPAEPSTPPNGAETARPPRAVPGERPRKRARVYRGQRFD